MLIRNDPDNDRYVAEIDDTVAGFAIYLVRAGRSLFVHTEVDDHFEGQGVGSALVRYALEDTRDKGRKVVPLCPFVAGYVERHPEYGDIVDSALMDLIDQPPGNGS